MNFAEMRSRKGLTQYQVSVATGISEAMISLIESGKRKPSVKKAKKLGKLYGVSWTQFFKEV